MKPIINSNELFEIIHSDDLILVDAGNGESAKSEYIEKHLIGALFVDLNTELADIKENLANGGRHPLPSLKQFSELLGGLGITLKTHVVIYDTNNGANAASRFWWMLKSIGHEKVQVLNGGFQEARKQGFPINNEKVTPKAVKAYTILNWKLLQANIKEVEKASLENNYLIIDVRSTDRFNGETEPIDLIAGHIPNAINVPFTTNLDENGLFLPPIELKEKYQQIIETIPSENVIVHCGSGVTACHTLLAMDYAGLQIPKLYVGSWSEWSRNKKPMITK